MSGFYDVQQAVDYAHRWAYGRNPRYANFDAMGGDCTNFTSQCLFAGSGRMNYTKTFGWYYRSLRERAPAWTGVVELHRFLTQNRGPGPYGHEATLEQARAGDVIQLRFANKNRFSHSPFIVRVESPTPEGIFVAAHTDNCDNRPLSTYVYAECRVIVIDGVR